MKLGVNTFIWSDHFDRTQIGLLDTLKQAGFDGVELPLITGSPAADPEVRRALERTGLECTFVSIHPPGLNTISDDRSIREKSKQHWKECVRVVAEMGGKLIAGPFYSPVGHLPGRRRTSEEWRWAVECFQQLGPTLEEYQVTLAIEPLNRYETYFLNTSADAFTLCQEINHPNVGILFDTYHANIEEKDISEAIVQAGPYLRHFHSCENDRGTPGTGHIEWHSVIAALRHVGYEGWLTIEGFGFSAGPLSAAASIWRDLAPVPEAIAFDGLRFLRALSSTTAS